jgi:HlyD family secretion protein
MPFPTKTVVSLAVIALLAGGGYYGYQQHNAKEKQPTFRFAKVDKGAITASVSATGTLNPVVSVSVGSQVSGQLKELFADFNQEVKKGQLIARIDPETFEYRVRQSQADVDAARANILTQEANIAAQTAEVARAEFNAGETKRDFERKKTLVEKRFIAESERDKAESVMNAALAQVQTAKAQLAVAQAQSKNIAAVVAQREAALAQAKIDLERTAIRSPVDGIVVKRSVEPGQTVAASLSAPELFVIAQNLTDMQVDTSIDEAEIGRVRLGQRATFTVDSFQGRTFTGEVKQIRKAATVISNVVTYTVVISATNPDLTLLPGMTANVKLVIAQRDAVLRVPNAALRYRPPGATDEPADSAKAGEGAQKADGKVETKADAAKTPTPSASSGSPPASNASPGGGRGGALAQMKERLTRELSLTAEQQTKVDEISAGMRDKFMALRDMPEEERRKARDRVMAELREKVAEILTPEQKTKYQAIQAEAAAARAGGVANTRGRVWVPGADGKPQAVSLRLGLTDGSTTEVVSVNNNGKLDDGQQVIIGQAAATANKGPTGSPPRLPF